MKTSKSSLREKTRDQDAEPDWKFHSLHLHYSPVSYFIMATDLRADDSHNISYPTSADSRGSARIYHLRKPYYLGNHDSPLSYVMFGIWKHHLNECGIPPATADIRERAESVLGVLPNHRSVWSKNWLMGLAVTLALVIGVVAGANFRSTPNSANVDGIALSANDMEIIRRLRQSRIDYDRKQEQVVSQMMPDLLTAIQGGQIGREELRNRIRKTNQ